MPIPIQTRLKDSIVAAVRPFYLFQERKSRDEIERWQKAGKPVPPPHAVKFGIVSAYASSFGANVFIETGTFLGTMDYSVRNMFRAIYSIELGVDLSKRARSRLRFYPHIQIVQGDSGKLLPQIMKNISERCLFWLDGHYSEGMTAKGSLETPIVEELETIFEHGVKDHVILIDDARCFDGTHDYPTLEQVRELVARHRPDYVFSVADDVIRIHPPQLVQVTTG